MESETKVNVSEKNIKLENVPVIKLSGIIINDIIQKKTFYLWKIMIPPIIYL